jgi:acetyl esterase/lipase
MRVRLIATLSYLSMTFVMAGGHALGQQLDQPLASEVPTELAYSDHSQLLIVRDAAGGQRPVKTKKDWALRVSHIKANMQRVMGPLPDVSKKAPLQIKVLSSDRVSKYDRQAILFSPDASDRVPAWLLIPHDALADGTTPAMLCLHQTIPIGKDEPVGLGGSESLHYAHELAEHGYVCIVPDYPSFGEYKYDFKTAGTGYESGSMKAIWNNIRAVDVLESLPQVDKNRIGTIGHSLGGHNSLFTAVFDDRIKAVVSSCGFTSFHDYYKGNLKGWTSDRYMPRIRDVYDNDPNKVPFDFYEIIAALAPRGFYSNSPINDNNFDVAGVRKVFEKASDVYSLFEPSPNKHQKRLTLMTPSSQHDFPKLERMLAYEWLDEVLR